MTAAFQPTAPAGSADPVLDLAIAISQAVARHDRAQAQGNAPVDVAIHFYDLELSLKDMLSHHKASSLLGATAQMAVMLSKFDDLCAELPEAFETYRTKKIIREVNRLAYSIFAVLRETAGADLEKITHCGFYSPVCDPWDAMETLENGDELTRTDPIPALSKTTIADLFDEWQRLNRRAVDETLTAADMDAASIAANAIDQQMRPLRPATAREFAMKFVVETMTGSLAPGDAFIAEALEIAGYEREAA